MSPALLGRTFCTRTSQEENKKQRERTEKQDNRDHISFCNFSLCPTQGYNPLPIPSKSCLPQPCFSSLSHFFVPPPLGSLESDSCLSLIGSSPNCLIPPSNSLHCHLPSTFIFQSCLCSSLPPVLLQIFQTNVNTSAVAEQTIKICQQRSVLGIVGFNPTRHTSYGTHVAREKVLSISAEAATGYQCSGNKVSVFINRAQGRLSLKRPGRQLSDTLYPEGIHERLSL